MIQLLRRTLKITAVSVLAVAASASAQTDLRVSVADMKQDLASLLHQVKSLRLEVEQLRAENARLARSQSGERTRSDLLAAIEALRTAYKQADEAQKQSILAEVNRQMQAFAKETQAAVQAVVGVVSSRPATPAPPVNFSEDYPKTGKTYVVRSGDTLSKIARQHGSSIKHIQNANKIANPSRDLQVGQTIFIPIAP
ncbi:MAG: peptidoglycan-binding protein [Puniceicoccaceae bacterium MED-G30]|nr:MAG: peptidoglycan-binding protein [Puniceicoccaceae bacterium MED-G30]